MTIFKKDEVINNCIIYCFTVFSKLKVHKRVFRIILG